MGVEHRIVAMMASEGHKNVVEMLRRPANELAAFLDEGYPEQEDLLVDSEQANEAVFVDLRNQALARGVYAKLTSDERATLVRRVADLGGTADRFETVLDTTL